MSVTTGAVPGVTRGCGKRQKGGVYAEVGLVDGDGRPVHHFVLDPPQPLDPDHKVGVELVDFGGQTHVVDWIGEQHYATPWDFIDEVAAYGLSRRLPRNLDFSRLGPGSRIVCVHRLACVDEEGRKAWVKQLGESHHVRHPLEPCIRQTVQDTLVDRKHYTPGVIIMLPLSRIAVVHDDGGAHEETIDKIRAAGTGLPVEDTEA